MRNHLTGEYYAREVLELAGTEIKVLKDKGDQARFPRPRHGRTAPGGPLTASLRQNLQHRATLGKGPVRNKPTKRRLGFRSMLIKEADGLAKSLKTMIAAGEDLRRNWDLPTLESALGFLKPHNKPIYVVNLL